MSIRQYLTDQHQPTVVDGKQYISFRSLIIRFKRQRGKGKTTNKQFVETHELEYIITNNRDEVADVNLNEYQHSRHRIRVSIDSLLASDQLLPLITEEYNESLIVTIVNQPVVELEPQVILSTAVSSDLDNFELLYLDDHEMLVDHDNNPVDIEMRGIRSAKAILLRAQHIGKYLGMEELLEMLQDPRSIYIEGLHWIKLYRYGHNVYGASLICYEAETVTNKIYLTLEGLLKLVFCATTTNENLAHLRGWVLGLVAGHRFGSIDERLDLIDSAMPSHIRYKEISGIFLMRIGTVSDLRESMGITNDIYPSYKSGYVFKYGISDNIIERYERHCSKLSGYGQYSDKIRMEWMVQVPPNQCDGIDLTTLDKFFDQHTKYTLKGHRQLFITEITECVNTTYFDLARIFLSANNTLMSKAYKLIFESTIRMEIDNNRMAINLMRAERPNLALQHKVDMLQLQLDRANARIERANAKLEQARLK